MRIPCQFVHPDELSAFQQAMKETRERQAAIGDPEATVALQFPRRFLLPNGEYINMLTSGAIDRDHWCERFPQLASMCRQR